MRLFDFPDRPLGETQSLWRACLDLVQQLGPAAKGFPIDNVTVGITVTAIRHGRGGASSVSFEPYADCRWWRPQPPDSQFVYLQASVATPGTVRVWP